MKTKGSLAHYLPPFLPPLPTGPIIVTRRTLAAVLTRRCYGLDSDGPITVLPEFVWFEMPVLWGRVITLKGKHRMSEETWRASA